MRPSLILAAMVAGEGQRLRPRLADMGRSAESMQDRRGRRDRQLPCLDDKLLRALMVFRVSSAVTPRATRQRLWIRSARMSFLSRREEEGICYVEASTYASAIVTSTDKGGQ